ncbi:MAG: P27 family phage terminase small subunit [Rhodospirillales bacterium]|nr:P27 family phage terminase small subunit [Rhodospirillales bacterium]
MWNVWGPEARIRKTEAKRIKAMPRNRIPTALANLHGNPGKRGRRVGEPQPPRGAPIAPAHLSPEAAAAWPLLAATLSGMGVLSQSDGLALEHLAEAVADARRARDALAAPVVIGRSTVAEAGARTYATIGKSGAVMLRARPEAAMLADADRRVALWASRFGLSPADRVRLGRDGSVPDLRGAPSAFDQFLASKPAGAPRRTLEAFLADTTDLVPSAGAKRQRR